MDEAAVYEHIQAFAATFSYSNREGIALEMAELFFRLQMEETQTIENVALFFDYETNHYRVAVILKDFSLSAAQSMFTSFFGFLAYAGANITASKKTRQGVHYLLASFDEQGKGLYCELDVLSVEAHAEGEEQQHREEGTNDRTSEIVLSSQRTQPAVQWKCELDSASYFPLLATEDLIYSVGERGDLSAVDARQGTLRWHWRAEQQHSRITTLPGIDQGMLIVSTSARSRSRLNEAMLFALDARTGQRLWSTPVPALQSIGRCHLLTTHHGVAYLSGTDQNLLPSSPQNLCLALDLQTGRQRWRVDLGRHLGTTTPVVANAQVYLVTYDLHPGHPMIGYLHALDIQTGEEIWSHRFETRGIQELAVDGTKIFLAGTHLEVIDALTGGTMERFPDLHAFRESPLAVNEELICISYEQASASRRALEATKPQEVLLAGGPLRTGKLVAIERASKQPQWIATLTRGRNFPTKPVLAGSAIYTTWEHLDSRGVVTHATLFALDAHTGQERWQFEAQYLSSPLVGERMIFVRGQEDEKEYIYALSEDNVFSHAG